MMATEAEAATTAAAGETRANFKLACSVTATFERSDLAAAATPLHFTKAESTTAT
jgi:hypothetical protein